MNEINPNEQFRRPTPESEQRLVQLRHEAQLHGQVSAAGVRVPGAPFPIVSPEHGYYGVPLLKQPQWTWQVPVYFFVGGAAASAAVIGAISKWTVNEPELTRDARYIAATGSAISGMLLIADLGRHTRFLNMLRVFKPQSVMSVGAWLLAAFGSFSGATAAAQFAHDRFGLPTRILGNISEVFSCVAALPFSNYTGVLIGATVIPVWNENIGTLPLHFGMSGLNSGVGILELMGHTNPALNVLGIGASALETYEGYHLERVRDPEVNRPLKRGFSGWITRAGGVLSGPVPLALRIAAEFAGSRNSQKLRRMAAMSSLAGSMLTRWGWFRAGFASAKDYRIPLQQKQMPKEKPELQSQDQFPSIREMA